MQALAAAKFSDDVNDARFWWAVGGNASDVAKWLKDHTGTSPESAEDATALLGNLGLNASDVKDPALAAAVQLAETMKGDQGTAIYSYIYI